MKLLVPALALAALGGLFWALERRWPANPGQRRSRLSLRTDLAHLLVSPLLLRLATLSAVIVALVALALITGRGWSVEAALDARTSASWIASRPLGLQLLALVVLNDLVGYWVHRCFHRNRELWRFHAVHHSSRELDWLASVRAHPVSGALNRVLHLFPMVLLGFDPRIVAGLAPALLLYGLLLHANVSWRFGPLRYLIASPAFHRWHHAAEAEGRDKNFAGLLPVWDLIFGTFHLPARAPARCGVDEDPPPAGFWGQLRHPFVEPRSFERPPPPSLGETGGGEALGAGLQ